MEMNIRKPAAAGTFYPADTKELELMLEEFFAKVPPTRDTRIPKALIAPHAGYMYSGQVAAYGYARVCDYKKVIILGPSHHVHLNDVVGDTHQAWETPFGVVKVINSDFVSNYEAHAQEHCLEVQVPFLQFTLKKFKILPLVAGDIDVVSISIRIQKILNPDTLLVISSDLSHYHDYTMAVKLDTATIKAIESLDAKSLAEACGEFPIRVMINIARARGWKPEVLGYKNSGDMTADTSRVVGYASVAFYD
jgi:AmmeMemoRadiSam system protein B